MKGIKKHENFENQPIEDKEIMELPIYSPRIQILNPTIEDKFWDFDHELIGAFHFIHIKESTNSRNSLV